MMRRPFTLEYWIDDGWFVGRLKEIPGVFSQGETLEELEANIEDAYALMREGEEAPIPAGAQMKEVNLDVLNVRSSSESWSRLGVTCCATAKGTTSTAIQQTDGALRCLGIGKSGRAFAS